MLSISWSKIETHQNVIDMEFKTSHDDDDTSNYSAFFKCHARVNAMGWHCTTSPGTLIRGLRVRDPAQHKVVL